MTKLDEQLLSARYGTRFSLPSPLLERTNSTIQTILNHRSIRHYNAQPLEPGVLEILIASAQSASTSSNLQTYSIISIEDTNRKKEISVLAGNQKHIVEAPLFLVFCADLARLNSVCESMGSSSDALDYAEMFIMSVVDATLAAQNFVVAAESLGLGTCYIGGARNHPARLAALLNLPPKVFAVFGLTVGYPGPMTEQVKPRLAQNGGILHRERYNSDDQSALEEYDATMKNFNNDHSGREGRGWLASTARRVATAESLGAERPQIKQHLADIGLDIK